MAARLTPQLFAAGAFLVTLAALAAGLFIVDRSGEAAIQSQQSASARSTRDYYLAFAREEGVPALAKALDRRERSGSQDGFRYALVSRGGKVIAGADIVGDLETPDTGWATALQYGAGAGRQWRVLATPMGEGETLVVAEDLSARDGFRAAILRGSAIALALTAAAVMALGIGFNAILYRRANSIAHVAERIAAGDLGARAEAREGGDVFDHLGAAVNAMLARIEALMTGMRTVTDSVAHDLRSPLSRMQGALDRALAEGLDERARLEAIGEAHEEADRAIATLSALMDIINAESGLSREVMANIDLSRLVAQMGELFEPVLEDAGQVLTIAVPTEPVVVMAHESLLRQALGNLLHNAAIHAGDGATVVLSLERTPDRGARIVVADNGPGVPQADFQRVRERFVRLDEARSRPGSGLGLSIADACANLHGGKLVLSDNGPGLRAVIEMSGE